MADDKNHRVDAETYRRYLSGNMTPAEQHAFEKAMLDDPFAFEALEGMESLDPKHISADLNALKVQLTKRTRKKEPLLFWSIAAGLLLLGIFSIVIYYFLDIGTPTELAQEKPITTEQSDTITPQQNSTTDSVLLAEPDRIIAYQPPPIEKSAPSLVNESKAEESQILHDQVSPAEEEADVIIDDQVIDAPDQLEEVTITSEPAVKEVQSISGAISVVELSKAEKKKDTASGTRRQKAQVSEQPVAVMGSPFVAQERKIRGKVTSVDDDSATPGVNVVVKGSSTGTVTDIDGNYEVTVPTGDEATLVFSFIGFTTEEVALSPDETVVDIALAADVTALSEIVVVGYASSSANEPAPYSYTPPRPVGGQANFKEYIKSNLRYPASGKAAGITGSVKVEFTVEANGIMTNLLIIRSLGEDFDNEAMRLVKDGPDWEPAEVNGAKASRKVRITIRFKLPE